MAILALCASCARHVRTSEVSCPFCGAAIAAADASLTGDRAISRSAILFASAAFVVACGKSPPDATSTPKPEPTPTQLLPVPAYGAPPIDTTQLGASDASAVAAPDAGKATAKKP